MSKFVRSNAKDGSPPRLPGVQQQRHYADQVSLGEPYQLHGDAELKREIDSSLAIIARERLLEVEAQAKSFLIRAQDEAAKILEKANAQAREMLAQAKAEENGIRDKAHEDGFKSGFEEGYQDATTQVTEETQNMLQGAQILVDGAYQAEQRVMQHFETRTLDLIRHLGRQILHRELTDSPATVMHLIRRAIERLYISGKVQVVVSAQIIHELRSFATATEKSLADMHRFEFVADPVLEPHQLYIIGQDGCFDLSPDTQLEQYLAALEPALKLPRTVPSSPAGDEPETEPQPSASPETAAFQPEADPVAWEDLPSEIQGLGGFLTDEPDLAEASGLRHASDSIPMREALAEASADEETAFLPIPEIDSTFALPEPEMDDEALG